MVRASSRIRASPVNAPCDAERRKRAALEWLAARETWKANGKEGSMPTLDEVCVKWNLWDRSAVHYWVRKYTAEGRHLAVPLLPSPPAQVSTPAAAPDSGNKYKNALSFI